MWKDAHPEGARAGRTVARCASKGLTEVDPSWTLHPVSGPTSAQVVCSLPVSLTLSPPESKELTCMPARMHLVFVHALHSWAGARL